MSSGRYQCSHCGHEHDGIPAFHADRPVCYWDVPPDRRELDIVLTDDACVIADRFFFVHGCLEIPIIGTNEFFTWGVWVSLKLENFVLWKDTYEVARRSHIGPFFGWLNTRVPLYSDTVSLKTMVHLRDDGLRPWIELEPTDHALSIDQRQGISLERALSLVHQLAAS